MSVNNDDNTLQDKYQLMCAVCDDLNVKLQRANTLLYESYVLLNKSKGVIEENRVLRAENDRLTTLLEGRDAPRIIEIKA